MRAQQVVCIGSFKTCQWSKTTILWTKKHLHL